MHKKIIQQIEGFKNAYNDLRIGEIDDNGVSEILIKDINEIKSKHFIRCHLEVNDSGFNSENIKENILKGAKEDFIKFKSAYEDLRNSIGIED